MKFIRYGLQFPWFFERAIKSGKISSGTKLKLRLNFINTTSSCNLLLIYVVLLNNIKHQFFKENIIKKNKFFYKIWSDRNSIKQNLNRIRSGWTDVSTVSLQ